MFYQIRDKYYVKVGRKYIEVKPEIKDKELVVKPNIKSYIEDNGKNDVKEISYKEIQKKLENAKKFYSPEE